jgi:hypothetical protein
MQHFEVGRQLGRHAVIVSGHSLPTEAGVDFDQAAINLWRRLRPVPLNSQSRLPIVHFSVATGKILLLNLNPDGSIARQVLASFASPEPSHYGQRKENRRIFVSTMTRTLSMLDVYAYLFHLGLHSPAVLEAVIVVAHAWDQGPILLNTLDPVPHSPWRSPADKDARRKDLRPPQLGAAEREALRKAFVGGAFCINAGCGGYKALQPLLLRVEHGPAWDAAERRELQVSALQSWNQDFANAAGVPCFAAFPGVSTGLELSGEQPTLTVPQQAVADRPDFSPALAALQTCLGFCRDPWGLGLVRFDPQLANEWQ